MKQLKTFFFILRPILALASIGVFLSILYISSILGHSADNLYKILGYEVFLFLILLTLLPLVLGTILAHYIVEVKNAKTGKILVLVFLVIFTVAPILFYFEFLSY